MIDWTNGAHVMQALFWVFCFGLFVHGYNSGNRLV